MNKIRRLGRPLLLGLALTLVGTGYANAVCTPSTYGYCWQQRETCLVNGGLEEDCNAEYIDCLTRRGCGA